MRMPIIIRIPSQKLYNEIINDFAKAVRGTRGLSTDEDARSYAEKILRTCLTGMREDGTIWKRAPGKEADDWETILAKRLKVFGYDYYKKKMIPNISGVKDADEEINVKEIELGEKINPRQFTLEQQRHIEQYIQDILKEYPQLNTRADMTILRRLAYLDYLNEQDISDIKLTKKLTEQIKILQETLGISGRQREALKEQESTGTIADLIKIYKKTREEFWEIEQQNLKEEVKLLLNALERNTIDTMMFDYYIKVLFGERKTIDELKKFVGL